MEPTPNTAPNTTSNIATSTTPTSTNPASNPNPTSTTDANRTTHNPSPTAKPTKKPKPLLIGFIICAVLAVAGTAFGIYGLISSNHYSAMVDDLKSIIEEKDKTIASLKNPEKPESPESPSEDDHEEQPAADPYATFAANLTKNPVPVFGYYYHYTGSENVQRTVLANINNGHLEVTDLDDNNKLLAEAVNILAAYFIRVGNGGTPYFYLIHQDGKVSRIDLSESSDHAVTPLSDHANIVSVIEGSDLYAYLVDIDGNVYKTF